ncbi:MAG: hypothetical protein CL402_11735 [Acidiferrobacteraceae bacterium]|nr:hypothetical protein [Acidiferrobacteraceae bacterium]
MQLNDYQIDSAKASYLNFISNCKVNDGEYSLTVGADSSPYALCFAIFGLQLLQQRQSLTMDCELYDSMLRSNLAQFRDKQNASHINLHTDKPFLQLLAFTLSALSIIGTLKLNPLESYIAPLINKNPIKIFDDSGVFDGKAGTGNLAMFYGIILQHAREYLALNTERQIAQWVDKHISSMNRFGFWGNSKSMSHLQFQNGYHQYEIFEYLGVDSVPWDRASEAVASLVDNEGHFAPYIGGGGCYDYDAIHILTGAGLNDIEGYKNILNLTANTILSEQNIDGGFCESLQVRPRSLVNILRSTDHIFSAHGDARMERLRHAITLLRPKHNRISTHWSSYSRKWDESDLWDSWFRMLTIARIDISFDSSKISRWGFIDYPGIGFHPLLKNC